MAEYDIRYAEPDDVKELMELEKANFSSPLCILALAELVKTQTCVLADEGGKIVGYAAALKTPFTCEIMRMTVTQSRRRRGIGRALLNELIIAAKLSGAETLCLEVRSKNDAALALYTGAGFVKVGLRKGYYRQPYDDAVLMDLGLEKVKIPEEYLV